MRNAWLDEAQAGIKSIGRNINNLRYADDNTFMTESKEELKSLLMKVKEEVKKTFKKQRSWHLAPSLHGKQTGKKWKLTDLHFMANKWGKSGNSDRWGKSRNSN